MREKCWYCEGSISAARPASADDCELHADCDRQLAPDLLMERTRAAVAVLNASQRRSCGGDIYAFMRVVLGEGHARAAEVAKNCRT